MTERNINMMAFALVEYEEARAAAEKFWLEEMEPSIKLSPEDAAKADPIQVQAMYETVHRITLHVFTCAVAWTLKTVGERVAARVKETILKAIRETEGNDLN